MQEIKRGIGVNLVAFAMAFGVAIRRTRLEELGMVKLDVWCPEEGGWTPVRREVRVTTESTQGGGVSTYEVECYPNEFADLLDNPKAWSPVLPDEVMVDVLESQVDRLRDRVAVLEKETRTLTRNHNDEHARERHEYQRLSRALEQATERATRLDAEVGTLRQSLHEQQAASLELIAAQSRSRKQIRVDLVKAWVRMEELAHKLEGRAAIETKLRYARKKTTEATEILSSVLKVANAEAGAK